MTRADDDVLLFLSCPCSVDQQRLVALARPLGLPAPALAPPEVFRVEGRPFIMLADADHPHLADACRQARERGDVLVIAVGTEGELPLFSDSRDDESLFTVVSPEEERSLLRALRAARELLALRRRGRERPPDGPAEASLPLARRVSRNVAHDVKNHLSSIRGLGELLRLKINDVSNLTRFAETIMDEADHLGRMADSLHDFAVAPPEELTGRRLVELLRGIASSRPDDFLLAPGRDDDAPPLPPLVTAALRHLLGVLAELPGRRSPLHLEMARQNLGRVLRIRCEGFDDEEGLARKEQLRKWIVGHRSHSARYPWISIALKLLVEWGVTADLADETGLDLTLRLPDDGPAGEDSP